MLYIFSITMMLSSAILFLIELIAAKMLLPQFGGSTSVWTTCMLFYQVILLLGYIYAHYAMSFLKHKISVIIQLVLVFCVIYFLPIEISKDFSYSVDSHPIMNLILFLFKFVGVPFLVLSTTSSIVQKWFERSGKKGCNDPYFLYSTSNIGSLLALILYPFWIEPNFTLKSQSDIISGIYYLFLVLISIAGIYSAFFSKGKQNNESLILEPEGQNDSQIISIKRKAKWLMIAFIPSGLMIAVTSYLSQEIAISPNPFLWSLPLVVYLITFIISFSKKPIIKHSSATKIFSMVLFLVPLSAFGYFGIIIPITINFLMLFIVGILCHGLLAEDRPNTKNLTEFYIILSFGGALGGVFNSIISPLIFKQVVEYPILLVISCLFIPYKWEKPFFKNIGKYDIILPIITGALVILFSIMDWENAIIGIFIVIVLIRFLFDKNPIRLTATIALVFAASIIKEGLNYNILLKERDFYGTYKVQSNNEKEFTSLIHGNILHGLQMKQKEIIFDTTTYYGKAGPLGQFFKLVEDSYENWQVGVVGLGIGTSLGYKTENQVWTCYEISPKVIDIASNSNYFTFVEKFKPVIILGDARLSLKTANAHAYNLIILDAYSSDVIPVHLLTKEAFELYQDKLTTDGSIIINITNRTYNLVPVLSSLAENLGFQMYEQFNSPKSENNNLAIETASRWCILTKNKEISSKIELSQKWRVVNNITKFPVWTDQYSSLFKIMNIR